MLVHPDQNVRLAVEMRDHGLARWAPWKMFQECRGDFHVFESAAGLRFWFSHAVHEAVGPRELKLRK